VIVVIVTPHAVNAKKRKHIQNKVRFAHELLDVHVCTPLSSASAEAVATSIITYFLYKALRSRPVCPILVGPAALFVSCEDLKKVGDLGRSPTANLIGKLTNPRYEFVEMRNESTRIERGQAEE
jgi:hypothetical protein